MKSLKYLFLALGLCLFFACKNSPKAEAAVVSEASAEVSNLAGDQTYVVPQGSSKVNWVGTKVAGQHSGTIDISKGSLSLTDGKVTGGQFAINMSTVTCTDLDGEQKTNLEGHLKSEDFFDVANHPRGMFTITKVTELINNPSASHMVYGNLELKGVAKEVGFLTKIDVSDTMVKVATPNFSINRTDFGIKYGSSSFFDNLKDKAISDQVVISISLAATPG